MVEAVEHEGILVRWFPGERVVTFRYADDTRLTAEAADALIPVVARWVGEEQAYGILVDASDTVAANEAWRRRWATFHREHARRVRVAVFRASPLIRGFLMMYSYWSGVTLRCFWSEAQAREWLAAERGAA